MSDKQIQASRSMSVDSKVIEQVLLGGDLSGLDEAQRLYYYKAVCESLRLNPLTKPFAYIRLDGKLVLYAQKDATEQLRRQNKVSIRDLKAEKIDNVWVVKATAEDKTGRTDVATGAVELSFIDKEGNVRQLTGKALANALMKAETKAKRRVTLSICGLGMMDESEIESAELDQRPQSEIIERNVKQATANATETPFTNGIRKVIEDEKRHDTPDVFDEPRVITAENYGELTVHIGKAEGEMLGRKVKELHPNVIAWLYKKWLDRLGPASSEQDMRLKRAIEFAHKAGDDVEKADAKPPEAAGSVEAPKAEPPQQAMNKDEIRGILRERCNDLVITEAQALGYMREAGVVDAGTSFADISDALLTYLYKPENWAILKGLVEADLKPKVTHAKKRGRKKKT